MSPKEAKTAILTIKFSFRGDYLAVSYDNEQRHGMDGIASSLIGAREQDKQDTGFVLLYVNRLSNRNSVKQTYTKDPYIKLSKILPPTLDASQAHAGQKTSQIAVSQMDFSEDD